jgi:hypothetical protein
VSDSLDTFGEIRQIRSRLDAIEHTQEVLVRAQGKEILAQALAAFDADDMLAEVYLQVDGVRTQQDIAAVLQVQGRPGSKAMLVSRKLDRLYTELDLIALVDHTGKGNVYKKAGVDRILGITRQLEKRRANKGKRERTQPAGG